MGKRGVRNNRATTPFHKPINAAGPCRKIEIFICAILEQSRRSGIVVPISGGLDSSVIAAL